jgi:SAM-dependent methyltransferase
LPRAGSGEAAFLALPILVWPIWRFLTIKSFKSFVSGETIGDVLKRRGVRAVVYFHTDHFEPWRLVPDRAGGMERCVDDVESYLAKTLHLDFARKASLFYKANVNYLTSASRELHRADPDDHLGFVPRSPRDLTIGRGIVAPIVASNHDLQVHIHHEYFTYNDSARDPETFAYLQTPRGRSFDDARLELCIRLGLDTLREDGGVELARWFFIHGHWALNASDPHECTVVREIEILRRNGCLGDFTQPAGRTHVDSRIEVPYLVDPVALPKGYDSPEANPIPAAGAGGAASARFFIWAAATTHRSCSIDTYSPFVQQRIKTPQVTALEHARAGVVIDGVLYLKTHCHSLHPIYCATDGRPMPHCDPGVQAELRALFQAADGIGAEVSFHTVSEVYDKIIGAAAPQTRDLTAEYELRSGSPMAAMGLTVEFVDADGGRVAPPPLAQRPATLPAPSLVAAQPTTDEDGPAPRGVAPPAVAYIVPVDKALTAAGADRPDGAGALIDAAWVLPALLEAPDVAHINAVAGRVAMARAAELGSEGSGVTGFYGPRAQEQTLLQPSEILCAAFVERQLSGVHGVYEIGCGLGVLSTLLAMRGTRAVGVERNGARLATAEAIAEASMAASPGAPHTPIFKKGMFPKVLRKEGKLAASVALVTNLLGTASPEQQEGFVRGLRAFGAVLIDVQRFYVRRSTRRQIRELEEIFTLGGFDAPRLAFDLGPDGRFILFTNPRPRRRLGLEALLVSVGMMRDESLIVAT